MTVSVKLPAEFNNIYTNIFKLNPEESTIKLVINELHKRLAEFKLMDKMLQGRYKMDFEEFKRRGIVKESGYSFNVEEDYCDWELSSDGIKTITVELGKLGKYS